MISLIQQLASTDVGFGALVALITGPAGALVVLFLWVRARGQTIVRLEKRLTEREAELDRIRMQQERILATVLGTAQEEEEDE